MIRFAMYKNFCFMLILYFDKIYYLGKSYCRRDLDAHSLVYIDTHIQMLKSRDTLKFSHYKNVF